MMPFKEDCDPLYDELAEETSPGNFCYVRRESLCQGTGLVIPNHTLKCKPINLFFRFLFVLG